MRGLAINSLVLAVLNVPWAVDLQSRIYRELKFHIEWNADVKYFMISLCDGEKISRWRPNGTGTASSKDTASTGMTQPRHSGAGESRKKSHHK